LEELVVIAIIEILTNLLIVTKTFPNIGIVRGTVHGTGPRRDSAQDSFYEEPIMAIDYIPRSDADLLAFALHYSGLITATPTAYGLTALIATTLSGKVSTYQTAYTAAVGPNTRGPAAVLAKVEARKDLVEYIRTTAKQIQGTMTVTNAQRQALGLTVASHPSPIPPPAFKPSIDIVSVSGNTVRIRIHEDGQPTGRGRPPGVDGISLWSAVGASAPTSESDWTNEGITTKTVIDVNFPATVTPGSKVWFTAFYFNPRKQNGPAADPVGTNIAGGGAMAA
jgi:hypothetical protein